MHNNACLGIYLYLYSEEANRKGANFFRTEHIVDREKKDNYIKRAEKYVAPITGIDLNLLPVDGQL